VFFYLLISLSSALCSAVLVYFYLRKTSSLSDTQALEARLRLEQALERQSILELDIEKAVKISEQSKDLRFEAEKQRDLALQRVTEMQSRMQDWEKTREESMKTAKEAMFSTGGEIFRKEAEELAKKTLEEFDKVSQTVSVLHSKVQASSDKTDLVWRSLSTPQAIGNFSEIGLENALKNMGLSAGRDFIMQYHINTANGNNLRPDAVVFLPNNNIMVIDSKASKAFLELAQSQDEHQEAARLQDIKKRMNEHLRSLSSKNYQDAVKDAIKQADIECEIHHVMTLMFLHSESAVEQAFSADGSLRNRAEEKDIIIAGPTGLAGALSLARYAIKSEKQSQSQQEIIEQVQGLLGAVVTTLTHVSNVGKGMQSASKHYEKFVSSINRNLLPKARRLHKLGVEVQGSKELPANLPSYHVLTEESPLIEGQAEEENI
jgi:DNA recombination protein RmuC